MSTNVKLMRITRVTNTFMTLHNTNCKAYRRVRNIWHMWNSYTFLNNAIIVVYTFERPFQIITKTGDWEKST